MSTECKCSNGGGTRCPERHVAVCVHAKDGRCHGECVPIPSSFENDSNEFQIWLKKTINQIIFSYGPNFISIKYNFSF